jgi:hypothetical protein
MHSPDRAAERQEGRRKGGRAATRPATLGEGAPEAPFGTVADILALLGQTVNQVRRGELDPKVGNCVGYLASVGLRAVDEGALAREVEELRREVEGLLHGRDGTGPAAANR